MNDLEMIKISRFRFILKNAKKRVIENTSLIAPSNDENPIEYVIKYVEKEISR